MKPWAPLPRCSNRVTEHFLRAWRDLWQELDQRRGVTSPKPARPRDVPRVRTPEEPPYPVRCYWYRGSQPNFGDELAPYLVRKIAGLSPRRRLPDRPSDPRHLTEPVLLSVGSILRLCGPNAVVWGSGIRHIDQEVQPAMRFAAVRGPLTRRRLLQLGYHCPPGYGDPGLLLPRYYRPDVPLRYALGIIPHQLDFADIARMYAREPEVLVMDVRTRDVEMLIRQVLSCASTVSSALHGLVISVAYGVPTRWLRTSSKIMGDGSKFYDFFASLNPLVADALDPLAVSLSEGEERLDPYRPILLDGPPIPARDLIGMTFQHDITLDLDDLLERCPIDETGWKSELASSPRGEPADGSAGTTQ
jgi:pyruvyltransferase